MLSNWMLLGSVSVLDWCWNLVLYTFMSVVWQVQYRWNWSYNYDIWITNYDTLEYLFGNDREFDFGMETKINNSRIGHGIGKNSLALLCESYYHLHFKGWRATFSRCQYLYSYLYRNCPTLTHNYVILSALVITCLHCFVLDFLKKMKIKILTCTIRASLSARATVQMWL